MLHKVFYCAKLSNKQNAKVSVICMFDRLRIAQQESKAICVMEKILAAHAFDYIVIRINPGLTSCKDLATVMDNSLDNI